ncbi:mirror-image polydactyly gene 1 protein isoform X2 [Podarcis raffonei]|uniref:mirror-image polydactyly gene 1 protein isoform X2 n=1 Tax=Podarcis raffonei TaxID=65483 RepID=UPI0023299BEF|nr:mirror-image polydactyly gene 1 protein isoform X2 [Podarcis raffonei]
MEDWSKEILEQNSEQKNGVSAPSYLNLHSSSAKSQPREQAIQTKSEQLNCSDQPTSSLSIMQTACTKTLQLRNLTVSCTDKRLSSTEKQGREVMPDNMDPLHVTANLDKEKDITFLLRELDVLRTNNKKLQDRLSEKDKELKTIKLDLELQERVAEAKIAEKAAALVEEIHCAQRERDEAVMTRLKLPNEEREDACKRMKLLERSFETLENINPEENDMTLQELLNRINNADTGMAIWRSGAEIVDRIYRTQERKKKIIAEEMNAVIEERDAALAQEKLMAMQQEREAAVQQYKELEEELQTLRIYYSLHQSLSQEVNLKDQFNATLITYEKALKNREDVVSMLLLQNEELTTHLQQAAEERANAELKFQQALEASQEASEKLQKLQRLVDVLRKKIGAGTIRTVI